MKRCIYFMCLFAFIMASCSDDFTGTKNETHQPTTEKTASEIIQTLEKSFASVVTRNYTGEKIYPDYYGGVFLNDNGQPVVLVKGDCELYRKELTTRAASDNLILKPCDYSLNELEEVYDALDQYMKNNQAICKELKFYGFGLRTDLNRISVKLGDCSQVSIDKFKATVMNDSRIIFQKGGIMTADVISDNLAPGSLIISPAGALSTGYRAIRGVELGIVTAGHGISKNEELTFGSIKLGTCDISQYSGTIDAAFIKSNVSVLSETAYWNIELLPETGEPASNLPIIMEGAITQMRGVGHILEPKAKVTYERKTDGNTYELIDVCTATYPAEEGDSGGIVYDTGTHKILGIHVGHYKGEDEEYSSFCLASNINSIFGLDMY